MARRPDRPPPRAVGRWTTVATLLAVVAVAVFAVLVRVEVARWIPRACLQGSMCPDCQFYARGVMRIGEGLPPGLAPPYVGLLSLLGTGPRFYLQTMGVNGAFLVLGAIAASLGAAVLVRGPSRPLAALGAGVAAAGLHPLVTLHTWLRPDAAGAGLMAITATVGLWWGLRPTVGRSLAWGLALGLLCGVREHGVAMAGGALVAVLLVSPLRWGPVRLLALASGLVAFAVAPVVGWARLDDDQNVSMLMKTMLPLRDMLAVALGEHGGDRAAQWGAGAPTTPVELAALTWENLGTAGPWALVALAVPLLLWVRGRGPALAALCAIGPLVASFAVKTLLHHTQAMVPLIALVAVGGTAAAVDALLDRVGAVRLRWLAAVVPLGAVGALLPDLRQGLAPAIIDDVAWFEGWCDLAVASDPVRALLVEHLQPGDTVYAEDGSVAVFAVSVPGVRWGGTYPRVWHWEHRLEPGLLFSREPPEPAMLPLAELPDGLYLYRIPRAPRFQPGGR